MMGFRDFGDRKDIGAVSCVHDPGGRNKKCIMYKRRCDKYVIALKRSI